MLALVVWLFIFFYAPLSQARLKLASDSTFHISVFSDLHYGENESSFGIREDINSEILMRQVLSEEHPDLVILNGDLITGENTFAFNSSKYVDKIVAPLVEGGYGWASTYGNHDSKHALSREALFAEETKYPNALTKHGPSGTDGVTNYVVPVFPANKTASNLVKPAALLWFFDSRGGSEYQSLPANADNIDNYVSNGTVAWFRSAQAKLQVWYPPWHHLPLCLPVSSFLYFTDHSLIPRDIDYLRGSSFPCFCSYSHGSIRRSSSSDFSWSVRFTLPWLKCGCASRSAGLFEYRG